jgi:hypothetical protein
MSVPSGHQNGHRFAASERDCGVVDPHRDRIAAERAFMQDLDLGTLDESQLEQTPLKFHRLVIGSGIGRGNGVDAAAESLPGQS